MARRWLIGAVALSSLAGAAVAQVSAQPDPSGLASPPHDLATMTSRTVVRPDGSRTESEGTTYQTMRGPASESTSTTITPPAPVWSSTTTTSTTTTWTR